MRATCRGYGAEIAGNNIELLELPPDAFIAVMALGPLNVGGDVQRFLLHLPFKVFVLILSLHAYCLTKLDLNSTFEVNLIDPLEVTRF